MVPRKVYLSNPDTRWTAAKGGIAYLIDTDNVVILDLEVTPAHRVAEVYSTRTMIVRVQERFDRSI